MAAFTCPDCESRFRLSNPPSGRKVTCPECGFAFRPEDEGESRPVSRRKTRDDEDYDRPRKKAGSGAGLLIGLVLAGGFALLAAVVGLVWFAVGREAPKDVAGAPPANPMIAPPPQVAPGANVPPKANREPAGDLIAKTRRATALIRVDAGSRAASGSGFIIQSNGDTAYLITNHHVIDLRAEEPAPPQGNPGKFPGPPRPPGFPGRPGFGPGFPGFPGRPGANPAPQPKTKTRDRRPARSHRRSAALFPRLSRCRV